MHVFLCFSMNACVWVLSHFFTAELHIPWALLSEYISGEVNVGVSQPLIGQLSPCISVTRLHALPLLSSLWGLLQHSRLSIRKTLRFINHSMHRLYKRSVYKTPFPSPSPSVEIKHRFDPRLRFFKIQPAECFQFLDSMPYLACQMKMKLPNHVEILWITQCFSV